MYYGIIFSVDTDADRVNDDAYWPVPEDVWGMTEDNESEYECFRGTLLDHPDKTDEKPRERWDDDEEGGGWHYKWAACLDQEQMDAFMEKMRFYSICSALGALGMPQPDGSCNFGHCPAFVITTDDPYAYVNAYVTPYLITGEDEDTIPELKLNARKEKALEEGDWEKIMDWFAEKYKVRH